MNRKTLKHLISGGILIAIGLIFLFDQSDWISIKNILPYWPFLFVFFGLKHILLASHPKEYIEGSWLIFIGLWLYVSLQHVFGLSFSTTWPFILIFWGLTLIVKEIFPVLKTKPVRENYHGE